MKFYHVSYDTENFINEFIPRIPTDRLVGEDDTIKRICVAPTLSNCLTAVPWKEDIEYLRDEELPVRVYEIEVTNEDILSSDYLYQNNLVNDANITNEYWILNNIKPRKVYDIIIEEYAEKSINNEYQEFTLCKYRIDN